jgi:N-acetylglucosamine kinase-like BadF-type ATPase
VEKTLIDLFDGLYLDTGLGPGLCVGGFAGIAGIGREGDKERVVSILKVASRSECTPSVDSDAVPALVGALGKKEGILLIAGTGSIVIGMSSEGRIERSGGWGHILGDEGSAYDVARKALNACTRFHDGIGSATKLLQAALDYFGCREAFDLIPAIYGNFDKSRIAGFAERVSKVASIGDPVAQQIMSGAARDLTMLVVSVAHKMEGTLREKKIAFAGGFIENDGSFRNSVRKRLAVVLPDYSVVPAIADASTGACTLAREEALKKGTLM